MAREETQRETIDIQKVREAIQTLQDAGDDVNPFTLAIETNLSKETIVREPAIFALIVQARGGDVAFLPPESALARRVEELEVENSKLTKKMSLPDSQEITGNLGNASEAAAQLQQLEGELEEAYFKIDQLQEERTELGHSVAGLERVNEALNFRLRQLEDEIKTLKSASPSGKADVNAVLLAEHEKLKKSFAELIATTDKHVRQIVELEEFAEECQYKTSVAESRMDELQHEADMLAAQLQNAWNIAYQTQAAPAQAPQQAGLPVTAEIPMIAEAPAASAEPVFPGQSMPFDHTLNLSDDYPDDDTTEEIPAASRSDLTVSSGAPDVTAEQADHLQVEPDTAPAPRATFAPVQEAHDVDHVYNFIKPNPYVSSEYNPLDRLTWRELETVYSMGVLSIKDFAKHIPAAPPPTPPVFARTKEQPATPAPPPAANLPTNPPANPTASPPPPQNNAPAKPNTPPPKPVVKAEAKGPAKPKAASKGGWASMSDTMMGLPQLKPEELVALSVAKQEERKDEQQSVEYGDQAYGQDLYEQVPTAEEQQPEQYAQQYDMDGQPVEYTQDPYSQQYAQGQDPYAQQYAQGQTDQYAYQQYMQGQPDQYAQQSYGQGQAAPYAQEQYGQGQSDPYAQQQYVQGQQDPYAQQQYAQDQSDQYGQQPDQYGQQPYIQGQAEQYDQYPEQPDQYDSQYAQPFEGHQHPEEEQATEMPLIDFEQADMFEDLEDLEELGQIDIPNDPISPQSLDSLTTDQPVAEVPPKEKVSGEELRDLIKSRIAQAKSNPAGDFLGSDDELEVHQTAAAGAAGPKPSSLASKFIGGKGRAQGEPAAPQAPAPDPANLLVQTKHVPPDIRKFCQYLGLRPQELTRELILKEWKRQMSEVHPDLGGDHDLAIDLNLAKERLLKWLDENEPKLLKKFGGGGGGGKEMSSRFTGRGKQDKS